MPDGTFMDIVMEMGTRHAKEMIEIFKRADFNPQLYNKYYFTALDNVLKKNFGDRKNPDQHVRRP